VGLPQRRTDSPEQDAEKRGTATGVFTLEDNSHDCTCSSLSEVLSNSEHSVLSESKETCADASLTTRSLTEIHFMNAEDKSYKLGLVRGLTLSLDIASQDADLSAVRSRLALAASIASKLASQGGRLSIGPVAEIRRQIREHFKQAKGRSVE
jgi:hypothetical protein